MATWTNITNAALEPGKPIRSVDGIALRDNPIAIAEGASGAPRIDGAISPAIRNGGIPNGELGAEKFQTGTTERDWVLARTSGAAAGAVGTYAFAGSNIAGQDFGDTLAGSNLSPSNAGSTPDPGTLSGTWRCMGFIPSVASGAEFETLWLRIS